MAIYRCEFKIISRSAGHRACAAAAYRAASKISDQRYGMTHDYSRKSNVAASFILTPENAPAWMRDRTELWNAVEAAERRKDAQLSREVLLSLPHELTDDQREALIREFVSTQFVSKGMVADVNIHAAAPSGDERNCHAHVMLTTRTLTAESFGPKERSWNSKEFIHDTREAWALAQNKLFAELDLDLHVDHRSLADQGIDREPEPKLGNHATEAMRNGEPELANRAVDAFEAVAERNAERARLEEQREVVDLALARLDRAQDPDSLSFAGLAFVHVRQMTELQQRQADAERSLKAHNLAVLRKAVREARDAHAAYRDELKPGFFRRLGEIVTLKGKERRQERDRKMREFNSLQDAALNALRKELRHDFADLKSAHAQQRDDLRGIQARDRDALARDLASQDRESRDALIAQREDIMRALEALHDTMEEPSADAPDQLAERASALERDTDRQDDLAEGSDDAQVSEEPQEQRTGLSGAWDRATSDLMSEELSEGSAGRSDDDRGDGEQEGDADQGRLQGSASVENNLGSSRSSENGAKDRDQDRNNDDEFDRDEGRPIQSRLPDEFADQEQEADQKDDEGIAERDDTQEQIKQSADRALQDAAGQQSSRTETVKKSYLRDLLENGDSKFVNTDKEPELSEEEQAAREREERWHKAQEEREAWRREHDEQDRDRDDFER